MLSQPQDARILVVDDDEDVLRAARLLLKRHFTEVHTLSQPAAVADWARRGAFDVLLLDMNFAAGADDGAEGLAHLAQVLAADPQAVVVMVTAHSDVGLAVEAMKGGAADFVAKPWENERLVATLTAGLNLRRSRQETAELRQRNQGLVAATTRAESNMLGTAPAMLKVFGAVRRTAPTDANVLILGENGTGKELVAREIHRLSRRVDEVFLRVDLGALSPQLFESELFGHRRGAFTDAKKDRTGYFRAATGGTLFLDEIGNVPLHLQSRLLTALERREVVPVGAEKPEPIDVRLICATNLDRERLADQNSFRQDLLYRINTVEIPLPALRERREDIPQLLQHFTALYSQKYNLQPKRLSAALIERLTEWDWPGNVRELRHAVERAVILSESDVMGPADFPLTEDKPASEGAAEISRLDEVEKAAIARALQRHQHNISRAAEALGLTRTSLYRRMESMDFSRFHARIVLQVCALVMSLAALTWMIGHTHWYVTIALLLGIAILQMLQLIRFASRSGREVTRFLNAVAFDDPVTSFSGLANDTAFAALGTAMTRVLEQLRAGRAEREEQTQYLQTLISHVPVTLISLDEHGRVQLLNLAARRLFESACSDAREFARYGAPFATGLENLKPGESCIVRMERGGGPLQLKAAATGVTLAGTRRRLISLQNIETELTAHELAAWQAVIRVMSHEVMNSLTPISSMAGTARGLVTDLLTDLPAEDARRAALSDVGEALETMARRSEGLLHFLQSHRRLTRRLEVKIEVLSVSRVFARLQRLLAAELATRHIELTLSVEPETLEVTADAELLDQALINLMRNAIDAVRDEPAARIALCAHQEPGAHVVISVDDTGPGIPPEQREKVFVPFFTTKRQGSGVGLTLVRQIATAHGATISISDAPGGGTRVRIRF